MNAASSPLPILAGAAATAALNQSARRELSARATTLVREDSTYYRDAWVGVGRELLEGSISRFGSH